MKWTALLVIVITGFTLTLGNDTSDINGFWLSESKDYIVQIYQHENRLKGTLVWLANPLDQSGEPLRDVMNNEPELRSRLAMGMDVLYGFELDDGIWKSGKIYNYKTGNDYNARLKLDDTGNLRVTGYYGMLFFLGKTKVWTRVRDLAKYGLE